MREPELTTPDANRKPDGDAAPEATPRQARQGIELNRQRYVLGISLALVVVVFAAIYAA